VNTTPNGEDKETMDDTKNPRKETNEWAIGSAYEFLGLSPEESAYVDLKLRLSKALKIFRMSKPLSQIALARRLGSSQSRVAKMERGDPSVTIDLLLRGLILLGVTRSEIAKILVFDEPKSLVLSPQVVASTGETKKPLFWGDSKYCPGKSSFGHAVKTYISSDSLPSASPIDDLVNKGEVAYV
jgi:transcriptional regulator with XRE-family HTH domain